MKINGYEVALSEADLDDKLNNQTVDVDLIKPDFPAYRQLSDGDKKAFAHLVKAARMFNDVFLEQDHKLDIELKEALEDKAASDAYAAKVLRFFNSLNGVEGLNGIDKEPVEIFKGVKGNPGRNFYPDDLSAEELQEILIKMLEEGKVDEVKKILSVRTWCVVMAMSLRQLILPNILPGSFLILPTKSNWPPTIPPTNR